MKTVILMFDSLNRRLLDPYGGEIGTPNFSRLAERSTVFDNSYCCSMPCIPARRDFHTGRPGFFHRPWGPLEPFDDSVPEILKRNGVHTHLCSDHYHYWEEGGSNYHTKYSTWESFRGQEGDPWKGEAGDPNIPVSAGMNAKLEHPLVRQDWVNREYMKEEWQHSQTRTIDAGLEFIACNADQDDWLLQVECFDPHEPYYCPDRFMRKPGEGGNGSRSPFCDWPEVGENRYSSEVSDQLRERNAALHRMCDESLGRIMAALDKHGLWDDTLFIVWTDHGILLNEHGHWLKNVMPLYDEIAHTPFFVWDPRSRAKGERRNALVQPAIDLGPMLLAAHGLGASSDMFGKDLENAVAEDEPVREAAVFGYFGMHANVTDGRYVYMRGRTQGIADLSAYTLMPCNMTGPYDVASLEQAELARPFRFSKNCPLLRLPDPFIPAAAPNSLLFDLQNDPGQNGPIRDEIVEERLLGHLARAMESCDAPKEQYESLSIAVPPSLE